MYAAVLPPLRAALANEWQVTESDGATALLEAWRPLLPPSLLEEMLQTQVMPRLEAQLSHYSPRAHPPPHTWLHPWLPLLPPPGLAPLFPELRHKLAATWQQSAAGGRPDSCGASGAQAALWGALQRAQG